MQFVSHVSWKIRVRLCELYSLYKASRKGELDISACLGECMLMSLNSLEYLCFIIKS